MESQRQKSKHSRLDREVKKARDTSFMKYYAIAFELVVMNVAIIVGGYYLDMYFNSSPALVLTATLLAMGATIWLLLKAL